MKYLDTYRDPQSARALLDQIARSVQRSWTLLEVCGGQAHNLLRFGIDRDLPSSLDLIHGPACPFCLLSAETIDRVVAIAERPGVIVAAPGDLLRVPGSRDGGTLLDARNRGAEVRTVYSPLDALALARKHPGREVVGIAAGFETTAPAAAATLIEAERLNLENLSVLSAFVRHAPIVATSLDAPDDPPAAVLVSGPVTAVTGFREFEPIASRFAVPILITGPDPIDLLDAIARAVRQLESGAHLVENQYARAVRPDGNPQALAAISTAFESTDATWRGLGFVSGSGLSIRERFQRFDADHRFAIPLKTPTGPTPCPDADLISGRLKPLACPAFGTRCTPDHPLGPFMVSAEGVCAAFYRYRRVPGPLAPTTPLAVVPTSAAPRL